MNKFYGSFVISNFKSAMERGNIMENTLVTSFLATLATLENYDKFYREIYMKSLDIDDLIKAKREQKNSFEKIQQIKALKSKLTVLTDDVKSISDLYVNEILAPLENQNDIQIKTMDNKNDEMRIGQYVRYVFQKISKEKILINSEMLLNMQTIEWTKRTFNTSLALIKKCDTKNHDLSKVKSKENNWYWKETFTINGAEYFVTSQWYNYQRERFDNWLDSIGIH